MHRFRAMYRADLRYRVGVGLVLGLGLGLFAAGAGAHSPSGPLKVAPVPSEFRVTTELAPQEGVTDLKFRDFFKLPIGPRGLEPTETLLSLKGWRVRVVGYMARQDPQLGPKGLLVLAPLPVSLGDEDESYADDLPAAAVYVHLDAAQGQQVLPYMAGLMALTGILEIGPSMEADGRQSMLRLQLDSGASAALAAPPHPSF